MEFTIDSPPVVVNNEITIDEGGTYTYSVQLECLPRTFPVRLVVTSSNARLEVSPRIVEFTEQTWDELQLITLSVVESFVVEGPAVFNVTHQITAGDPEYTGLALPAAIVHADDNDVARVDGLADFMTVVEGAPPTMTMVEGQGPYNVTLVLSAQPTSSVTVTLSISETFQQNEGRTGLTIAANTRSHIFRPDNWDTSRMRRIME